MPADMTHHVDSDAISATDYVFLMTSNRSLIPGTTVVREGGPTSNQRKTRQPQMRKQKGHSESSAPELSAIEASFTLKDSSFTLAHHDSLLDESLGTHPRVQAMPSKGPDSTQTLNPKLPQVHPSLSQLVGYATSADDGAAPQLLVQHDKNHIPSRQARKRKARRYPKSEEWIADESSSNSNIESNLRQQSLAQTMLSGDRSGQGLTSKPIERMNKTERDAVRPNDTVVAQENRKLPKTKGGFVLSDDSDTEDSEDIVNDDQRHKPRAIPTSQLVLPPQPPVGTSTNKRAPNTKQLNKSRLSKLLGRTANPFRQGPPKAISEHAKQADDHVTPPFSRHGPPVAINNSKDASRSQALPAQSNVGQRMQPNLSSTISPRTKGRHGLGTSPAPGVGHKKEVAHNPLRSTLQETRAGSSNTTLQVQQHGAKDSATTSARSSISSLSPKTISPPRAKQSLHRSQEPLPRAGETKHLAQGLAQDQLPGRGQRQDLKSTSHKTASEFKPGPKYTQKRKIDNMVGDHIENTAPLKKKKPSTSPGFQDTTNSKEKASVATMIATDDGKRLLVDNPAIDMPIVLQSKSALNPDYALVVQAFSRPELQIPAVEPSTSVAKKTSGVAGDLCTKDVRTLQAYETSKKVKPKDKNFSSKVSLNVRHDSITGNATPPAGDDAIPVSSIVRPDRVTNLSKKHQQQHTPYKGPVRGTSNIEVTSQDRGHGLADKFEKIELLPIIDAPDAEPYYEYSVFERRWSDAQDEYDVKEVDVISRPFTGINEANNQVEKLFRRVREEGVWHSQNTLSDWSSKIDEYGCMICKASFAHFDNPYKEHFVKIWVQRDYVSKLANRITRGLTRTSFISSIVYILRLHKVVSPFEESDSEGSIVKTRSPLLVYHPLIRSEVYTSLSLANRAARDQQLEISHEKEPKNMLTVKWQEQDLRSLNGYLRSLDSSNNGKEACWESKFKGHGIGGDQFELVVEQAGICGPRNL
ncbi:hypothetical protein T440DRAFT_559359 [Plenodomus tracheiphilus IPT5]|uniref:Uncharacterized protein n=1 Tax=Plenodomus tracheiphilus IPT5 TaxID=1408161 RepID=A0A6A7ANM3_9PLEO|nr:hypothetical protein T440DRAFT_559359 [Plenodomus tracheiphilus IPT5]